MAEAASNILATDDSLLTGSDPALVKPQVQTREFGDIDTARQWVYDKAFDAAAHLAPVSNQKHTLNLTDVSWVDDGVHSKAARKKAVLEGGTLGRRLKGTWVLSDNATGKEVSRKSSVVASIPHLTEGGTFVRNGTEYSLKNQMRLRSGIYTRTKDNGELETHVNVLAGGPAHRYSLDPAKGVFHIQSGQASIPLLPLLQEMDPVRSQGLAKTWGQEIYSANLAKADASVVTKLKERFAKKDEDLKAAFERMTLDPEVNRKTLGHPYDRLTYDAIVAATSKLLGVSRGTAEADDRDHLAYQSVIGPEDAIAERLKKDRAGVRRQLLFKASGKGHLDWLPSGALQKQVDSVLTESGLGEPLAETNSVEMLDKLTAVTRMGEGGIGSEDSIPDSSRSVHPSQVGFVDTLRTAESSKAGVDLFFANNARKGDDGRIYASFHDTQSGQTVLQSPQDVADKVITFSGAMDMPGKRIPGMKNGRLTYVKKSDVDLVLPHNENTFSPLGNMVPLKSMVKGQRVAMASRMLSQALSLTDGQAPLVQTAVPGTQGLVSFEDLYGRHAGAVKAEKSGKVLAVTPESIELQHDDGTRQSVQLHNNLPYNRKSFLNQSPALVRPGDRIAPGQLLAGSNYTDKTGAVALGANSRVAFMPWGGKNFEDAVVISESMSKRLSSEHAYQHQLELNDRTRTGMKAYVSLFPGKYDRKTLDKLDETGRIKPGQTVNFGDPLILGAEERANAANKLHRKGQAGFNDVTVTWTHHDPGVVTDVADSKHGPVVMVKSVHPMQLADKLAGRHGNKGVVAGIIPDAQMPHDKLGRPFETLLNPLGLISRTNSAQWAEAKLGAIAEKTGRPFKVEDFDPKVPDRVQWVRQLMQQHGVPDTEDVIDPATGNKIPGVYTGNLFLMKLQHTSESKQSGRAGGGYSSDESPAKGGETGCFAPKQKILTALGPVPIAAICEKRLSVQVRTYSEKLQEWVYRPVSDWFTYRADVADMLTIHTQGGSCDAESATDRTKACLSVTKNHTVFRFDGTRCEAGEIRPGDKLVTWGPVLTGHQREFLAGTLLGDATADYSAISFEHSIKQVEYLTWKKSVLTGFLPGQCDSVHDHTGRPTFKTDRVMSRVVWVSPDHVTREFRDLCYDASGIKRVTSAWLAMLSDFSVAVWVLDDGYIGNRAKKKGRVNLGGSLATHGFDAASSRLLVEWLNARYAVNCTVGYGGAIYLTADACAKLIQVVADWVPARAIPKSKKFLRKVVAERQKVKMPNRINSVCRLGKVPLHVSSVAIYKHDKPGIKEINVYDITVDDTHTYTAGHALVSNSKRMSLLDVSALLSHGASEVIRDSKMIRGQKNDDYWLQFMQGHTPVQPRVPLVYQKFINELKASGINVKRDGSQLHLMGLTDKDIDQLAGDRNVEHGQTVDFNTDLKPIAGGLFDPGLTGGHHGSKWSAIKLSEAFPSPVMEEPVRRLLGLTKQKFEDVIAHKEEINGKTGPAAINDALQKINVDRELLIARNNAKHGSQSQRDQAVRKMGYLKTAQRLGMHPSDWMNTRVPVLPPQFRPINVLGDTGVPLVSDSNFLYRELIEANKNLANITDQAGDSAAGEEKLAVYKAMKAVTGLGEPITQQSQEKGVKGILQSIFGSSPKHSLMQRKLLSTTVDNVGRAVIAPNPDLDMDSLGLPEAKAFDVYQRFIVRRLKRSGMALTDALRQVKDRTALARSAMLQEMDERPVIMNRAPVLHRYGIMAFKPVLVKGTAVQVPPLVYKGFGADNDGDAVQYHVPVDDEARKEALERMLPSRRLISPADFKTPLHMPVQEYLAGLWQISSPTAVSDRPMRYFKSKADVKHAWQAGEINGNDRVVVLDK